MPVIVDDGETIYESAIINEYLEEKYRNISMMPEEPIDELGPEYGWTIALINTLSLKKTACR
ncbi:MAG: hypothetical protein Ct9H90mP13_00660 [Pseudomonadota bacterium]|nr:MAG: hypothetical protein Ct9H90mP13_00660 [Pseudomonadota bacterium]